MPRVREKSEPATAPANSDLSPLEAFALSKAVGSRELSELRPRLECGAGQAVDLTVRIQGQVNVAEEATSTTTKSAGADKVLAFVLATLSARIRNPLSEALERGFAHWRSGGELPAIDSAAIDLADDLLKVASRKENVTKNGAVSAALEVSVVKRR